MNEATKINVGQGQYSNHGWAAEEVRSQKICCCDTKMQVNTSKILYSPSEGVLSKAGLPRYLKPGALAQFRDASIKRRADFFGSGPGCYKRQRCEAHAFLKSIATVGDGQQVQAKETGRERLTVKSQEDMPPTKVVMEPVNGQRKKHYGPKAVRKAQYDAGDTDMAISDDFEVEGEVEGQRRRSSYTTTIFSMPTELLVQIICCLRHRDLKFSMLACKRLREAALIARQMHFNFMTPEHYKRDIRALKSEPAQQPPYVCTAKAAASAAQAAEAAGTGRLVIPLTPRHGPRPIERRPSVSELRKVAAPLFQQSPSGSGSVDMPCHQSPGGTTADSSTPRQRSGEKGVRGGSRPPGLPKPPPLANNKSSEVASAHRMLFTIASEDDLCQAVINQRL